MSLDEPLHEMGQRGRAAAKRKQHEEHEAKLELIRRQIEDGSLVVRWAEPGELPPPARRSEKEGRKLYGGGRTTGVIP
jgi:hypothetical protein